MAHYDPAFKYTELHTKSDMEFITCAKENVTETLKKAVRLMAQS